MTRLDQENKDNLVDVLVDWSEILQRTYQERGLVLPESEAINRAWVLLIRGASPNDMDKKALNPFDLIEPLD